MCSQYVGCDGEELVNMKINLVYSWQVAAWITVFEYTISTLLVDELWSWNCLRAIPQFRLALGRMSASFGFSDFWDRMGEQTLVMIG